MSVVLPDPEVPIRATNLAPGDGQRDALEHRHVNLAEVVCLVNILQFDELHGVAISKSEGGDQGFHRLESPCH